MSKPIKAVEFDVKKVNFSENIKTNKYGGKSVYVNYNKGPFRIQMPKMSLPFGISIYQNPDKPEEIKYTMELSWSDVKQEVLQAFRDFEQKIVDFAEANSKEFFKAQKSRQILEDEFYRSFIKVEKDDEGNVVNKYPPRLKVKMYLDGDNFNVDAYGAEKVDGVYPKIKLTKDNIAEYVGKGIKCETIIQCSGLWVVGKTFGVSWVLVQCKIHKNENKLLGYAFEDEQDEEVDEVENDEVEHDDEVEPESGGFGEPEPEPEPVKDKKQRRKREYL